MSFHLTPQAMRNAQESSRRVCAAHKESWRASRARAEALEGTRLAECGAELQRVATALYGAGRPIPPAEGGMLFHEVCDALQRRGYDVTEAQLSVQAEKRGIWTCTTRDVINAHRPIARQEPEPVRMDPVLPPVPTPQACCLESTNRRRDLCRRCYNAWHRALRRAQGDCS